MYSKAGIIKKENHMVMEIRKALKKDLAGILNLYGQMHVNEVFKIDEKTSHIWNQILLFKEQQVLVGIKDNKVIATCVIIIVPNLTHNQRPYALIENVVTDKNYRKKGYAFQILEYAKKIAINENCYKIMLLASSKDEGVLQFYEKAGYNRKDKTAFIQWLD